MRRPAVVVVALCGLAVWGAVVLGAGSVVAANAPQPRTNAGTKASGSVGPSGTAVADVGAALARAQQAVGKREWSSTIAALSQALRLARSEAPLAITQAVVVDGPHTGLGVYRPIPEAAVTGGALRLYVEVENLVARPLPDGRDELSLDVAGTFSALDDDGKPEPLGRKPLGAQTVQTWRTTGVHSFGVDVGLGKDAPAGRYVVDLEVKDQVSGKSARKQVAFQLLPP